MEFALFTIDPKDIPRLKEWGRILMSDRKAEALETLREENRLSEAMYLIQGDGDCHVLGVAFFSGESKPADPLNPLNREHKKLLNEILKPALPAELNGTMETVYFLAV